MPECSTRAIFCGAARFTLVIPALAKRSWSSTRSVGSTVSSAAVMLVSAPSGTTIMSAPSRVKPTAMLLSMLRISVAPVKTTPLADRDGRDQQEAARLAAPEILQRQAGEQPQSVQERVCFMCSSLVGMITQS